MAHASIVPSLDADIHLVLCRFGRAGLAYIETDPAEADATTVVQNLLHGRYGQPLRVVALNVDEGWSQDVSEAMARKVLEIAEREDYELTEGTLAFMEAHSPRVVQPTCPYGEYDAYRTSPRSLNARHSFITAWQTAPVTSIAAAPTGSASRLISGEQCGEWNIGRIYEVRGGPEHLRWFWALHFPSKPESLRTDNCVATLEAAKAEFEESWRQWLAWAKLGEVE